MTFDEWYSGQAHQLSNEQVCRVIWDAAIRNNALDDAEHKLLVDALTFLRQVKVQAWRDAQSHAHTQSFSRADFGIDYIDAFLKRLDVVIQDGQVVDGRIADTSHAPARISDAGSVLIALSGAHTAQCRDDRRADTLQTRHYGRRDRAFGVDPQNDRDCAGPHLSHGAQMLFDFRTQLECCGFTRSDATAILLSAAGACVVQNVYDRALLEPVQGVAP